MEYDYNKTKSSGVSTDRLKKLEELMSYYGPVDENGYPEKVTKTSASYHLKEVETRRKAIVNICDCIKNDFREEYDVEKLRRARTCDLQDISFFISKAKEKALKNREPFTLTEEEETAVMFYTRKKEEEIYVNPDAEKEEFLSDEELEEAYGEESFSSLSKRYDTNYINYTS